MAEEEAVTTPAQLPKKMIKPDEPGAVAFPIDQADVEALLKLGLVEEK